MSFISLIKFCKSSRCSWWPGPDYSTTANPRSSHLLYGFEGIAAVSWRIASQAGPVPCLVEFNSRLAEVIQDTLRLGLQRVPWSKWTDNLISRLRSELSQYAPRFAFAKLSHPWQFSEFSYSAASAGIENLVPCRRTHGSWTAFVRLDDSTFSNRYFLELSTFAQSFLSFKRPSSD